MLVDGHPVTEDALGNALGEQEDDRHQQDQPGRDVERAEHAQNPRGPPAERVDGKQRRHAREQQPTDDDRPRAGREPRERQKR